MTAEADEHGITRREKYFSVEKYVDGDINDSFYAGSVFSVYDGAAGRYDWHVIRIEAYKDVDTSWINFELGF